MIRSYLGCIEVIEMISRRLTKTQKAEILMAFKAGGTTNALADKYNCTPNTINRTVKNLLSENEYNLLKKKRSKIYNKNENFFDAENVTEQKLDSVKENSLILLQEDVKEEDKSVQVNQESNDPEFDNIPSLALEDADDFGEELYSQNQININDDMDKNNQKFDNNFEEIAPLISDFDFELEKQKVDFEILKFESLPESVYMIVDKKVELDLKPISDLPEWSFLPENELKRHAILLFSNQRSAKRSCSKNQRVIKIPNTKVFEISKSYLVSKGITRLILEDSIIALEN